MQAPKQCPHYQRNCHVEANCCKIFYPCKLCHDEAFQIKKGCQVERMAFEKVQHLKCLECNEIQQPSTHCIKCNTLFGEYSCLKCKLFENNPDKVNDIYHCDDCKMCRRGNPTANTHCSKCGYCVPNSNTNHKCIEDVGMSTCPICMEVMKFSTNPYITLLCGHLIHLSCLEGYTSLNCPSCGMAMQKLSKNQNKRIEAEIQKSKANLPPELADKKVDVICNECLHKTLQAPFHFYGIKCQDCGTYNTKLI